MGNFGSGPLSVLGTEMRRMPFQYFVVRVCHPIRMGEQELFVVAGGIGRESWLGIS